MHRRVALAIALTCSTTLLAGSLQSARQKAPSLAERFPAPPGYSVEQDVESEGTRNFLGANGVRGHILRRFVQAGDDGPTSVPDLARFFADQLHAQNGILFDDHVNGSAGRLDGRIPGPRPVWLHVDINDSGALLDVIALEESAASPREMAVEESRIDGSWTTSEMFTAMPAADRVSALRARDALSALAAPFFKPLQGWAWQVAVEESRDDAPTPVTLPYRVRVSGLQRSQTCATCPVTTGSQNVTAFTLDVNRIASLGELDQVTSKTEGFFLDPGFAPSGQITKFKDGGRVLVTRAGRPALFVPVARGAYLEARIRFARSHGGATDELDKELMGLSEQDKSAPAADVPGRRIATLNPAYFETGRDRAAAHFAVIDIPWKYGVDEVSLYQCDLVDAFLTSARLADLVK